MTTVVVSSTITPYTNKIFEGYGEKNPGDLHVLQCSARESTRHWVLPKPQHYAAQTLRGVSIKSGDVSDVHFNPDVIAKLQQLRPDVVVLGGFTPTMTIAGLYSLAHRIPIGLFFGGSIVTDKGERSRPHGFLRSTIVPRASFACCPNEANQDLVVHWGMDRRRTTITPYPMAWSPPAERLGFAARPFDLLLSGSLIKRKNPEFFADVVERLSQRGFKPRVRIVGSGPLRPAIEARLRDCCAEVQFDGYLQQHQMAEANSSARLVLFPTLLDDWGLVANDAVACGTPILASPHAVSSSELVARYGTGLVRGLDVETWSDCVLDILGDEQRWTSFMARREAAMASFSIERAVAGFADGIALGRTLRRPGWRGASSPAVAAE